ncbi:molybdopterin-binding protein [Aestuariivirga sp.]|uniref:competence/damage-inducible protein A n=1 Tax=Aestuariivirga sp. TaxID=2650926 RepID=UPI0025C3902A|nr:molybdopterin-binding protein [Aestuariivirga sp.]MCA3555122.1 competence/damage-inducible protein A [Aestuariivirga sp.]
MTSAPPTAAVLLIGDEILSGRTKDKNLGFIADYMTALGIDLKEARLVPDVEEEIVAALNALRTRYSYVFTTGGIGPTHDDITADAVARAPGFQMGNVFVMAGVPKIMNAMMEDVATRLTRGIPMQSRNVEFRGGEGDAAQPLGQIQRLYPNVVIGSYPFQAPDGFATNLVLRSRDLQALEEAYQAVCRMAQALTAEGKARGWA